MHRLAAAAVLALCLAAFARAVPPGGRPFAELFSPAVPLKADAPAFHVAVDGSPRNEGTAESPWDLRSALAGEHTVPAGSIVWVRGGAYQFPPENNFDYSRRGYPIKLQGEPGKPIIIRGYPDERVRINGGMHLAGRGYIWLWDLEITVARPWLRYPVPEKGHRQPRGGLSDTQGHDCKYISLVFHDNTSGFRWNRNAHSGEVHGCIFYRNGWVGEQRAHGDCIYTQNQPEGRKRIVNSIFRHDNRYALKVYYSSAKPYLSNYHIEGNIIYLSKNVIGGSPLRDVAFVNNYLYKVWHRFGMDEGDLDNGPGKFAGNVCFRGRTTMLDWADLEMRDNLRVRFPEMGTQEAIPWEHANLFRRTGDLPADPEDAPAESRAYLIKHAYDPRRAHVAVFNWRRAEQDLARGQVIDLDVSGFMRPGQAYQLKHPEDLYGPARQWGTCQGKTIPIAVTEEFHPFVLLVD